MEFRTLVAALTALTTLILISIAATGCGVAGGGSSQPTKPIASITAPANGSNFAVGQEVRVAFSSADVKGVAQVELSIDGEPIRVEVVNPPVNSFAAAHTWMPQVVGSHVIEVRAFNVDGQASDLTQISVTVLEGAAVAATPTLPPMTPTPTLTLFTPTPTVTPESLPQPTPVPTEKKPMVTALVGLNVRTGPSVNYPVFGLLAKGESAEITGRDQFSGWWQIVFASAEGDRGWVAAGAEFSTATDAENVPVVGAPSLPAAPAPTATPTEAPSPLKPTIHSFTADRYSIAPGEQVTLRWDLSNAEAAFLRYGNVEEGVVAPGSKIVSPASDTIYTLVARNQAGETVAEVTIKVGGSTPTPVPVYRDGKIRIVNGQSVDFDQGVVQDAGGSGADFYWNGTQQRFTPQGGATGALLRMPSGDISLNDCLSATYGQPITGVDGSALVTGCYITSEGRYGKFFVSDWDINANLTITWLTWDYR
jgi:hypothetical protein